MRSIGFVLALTAAAAQAAATSGELKARATDLFRAKKYAQACDTFAAASAGAPADAAIVADLALCLQRLGRRDAAVEANRRAVSLAAAAADAQTRRNAYYNLDALGARVELPQAGQCGKVSSVAGCGRKLSACAYSGTVETRVDGTAWVSSPWRAVRFSASEGDARVEAGESAPMPDDSALDGTSQAHAADLLLGFSPQCPDCGEPVSCVVVSVDPCSGYIGLVCDARGEAGKTRRVARDVGVVVRD